MLIPRAFGGSRDEGLKCLKRWNSPRRFSSEGFQTSCSCSHPAKMHASLLVSFLLLFCRHISAAAGLGEPHGRHHINLDGRKIQKRHDDGSWDHLGSPTRVEIPEEEERELEHDNNDDDDEATAALPNEETTAPANTELPEEETTALALAKRDDEDGYHCRPLTDKFYLWVKPLEDAIDRFCKEAGKQGHHDKNSGGIHRIHYKKTTDEVELGMLPTLILLISQVFFTLLAYTNQLYSGVEWPPGSKERVTENSCKHGLKKLVHNCSRPTKDDNKHNVKAGGTYKPPGGVFTYKIQPRKERFDYNDPWYGQCDCRDQREKGPHLDCTIEGRGWLGVSGDNGDGFKDNVIGCRHAVCQVSRVPYLPYIPSSPQRVMDARIIQLTSLVGE